MHYHFEIYNENDGYWAKCIELDGCITQSDTLDELQKNMEEALNLYLNEPETSNLSFPLPKKDAKNDNIVKVPVDPQIAFALKLKSLRLQKGLTQKQIAEMLGMKNIYSYQRLESPKKVNPSLLIIGKIKNIFPDFNIDDIFISKKVS